MTTAASPLLGLALPVTGELSGTWGDTVNNSITSLLDTAVAGTTTLSADADVTLTTTTLAANQARQAIILWTAGGTVTRTITAPATSKAYIVINKTSSTQSIKIVGVGPTTGVTVTAGTQSLVVWNGADFIAVATASAAGITPVLSGGTGVNTATGVGSTVRNLLPSMISVIENATVTASAPAATTNFDVGTQAVQYYTTNAANNFVLNIRGTSLITLDSLMGVGQSVTIALMVTNGATAYYPTSISIDGVSNTALWRGGIAPTSGDINAVNMYGIVVLKRAAATYTVFASQGKFA